MICKDVVASGEVQSDSLITGTARANDVTVFGNIDARGHQDVDTIAATKYNSKSALRSLLHTTS